MKNFCSSSCDLMYGYCYSVFSKMVFVVSDSILVSLYEQNFFFVNFFLPYLGIILAEIFFFFFG